MKKFYLGKKSLLLLIIIVFFAGWSHANIFPKLLPEFDKVKLEVGETFELPGVLKYKESESSAPVDITVVWTVAPDSLGTIDESALFTALLEGEGELIASYDTISTSVELEIEIKDEDEDEDEDEKYPQLITDFEKVKLDTGETFQLPTILGYLENSESDTTEVDVNWTVEPDSLGTIDESALFTALMEGEGELIATYDTISTAVELEIETKDEDEDEDEKFPQLITDFRKVKLDTGETFQLPTMLNYLENSESDTTEVDVQWTVAPDSLGTIDELALFAALLEGEGELIATYDTISAAVELEIETKDEDDDEDDAPKVKIVPGNIRVELGDSLELYAFYIDTLEGKTDTTFMWSVEPAELGTFPNAEMPVFQADSIGKGIIIASLGELADTIKVEVYKGKWKKEHDKAGKGNKGKKITISPGDTTITTDAGMIQYTAAYKMPGNQNNETEITWSVSDTSIATINANGLLTLSGKTGLTLVTALINKHKTSVELLVIDPSLDPDINTITIHRVLPNGKALNPKVLKEGESYKIGGLPYPLNILNAGMLHFPFGCISEDISIFMKIPEEYATMNNDSTEVEFSDEIITGVVFDVQPAGSEDIVHPYWFDIPVELKLVFKRALLDSVGIDPENLDVFFADTGFTPVGDGFATVDSSTNRIYASIEHFSTIVVRQSEVNTSVNDFSVADESDMTIYPNPFSNSTTVQFSLAEKSNVGISVYNLFGQKVQVLADKEYSEGIHKISWKGDHQNGLPASSGIYFCKFTKDGKDIQTKKLILQR